LANKHEQQFCGAATLSVGPCRSVRLQSGEGELLNNIIVNKELCNGCRTCFRSCFIDVIKWDSVKRKPVIAYPEECVQCMYCEINCSERAIKVIPDYQAYLFPRNFIA
jgi:NAD-dependent dihydropyrimidine dehydrogenase PreA subunit